MVLTVGSKIKGKDGEIYTLDAVLGSGGFATVFKGHREPDGLVVAIKTLLQSFESEESMLSFQRELLQAEIISSDHVIKYLYAHDGKTYTEYPPYIIMEYANGGTLADIIDAQKRTGQPFDNHFILDACMQLAEGMKEISKVLVHRDIKPQNILIQDGVLKISDFGLSKYSGDATRTLTFKGYGTVDYVAPEAWGNDENTIQMDIYSMGIVFYEIATLQYPYQISMHADFMAYRSAHLHHAPRNPSEVNSNLPQGLVSVILKMMEKPTKKRFSDWDSIINVLDVAPKRIDRVSVAVEKALAKRNSADIQRQDEEARWKKEQEAKTERYQLVYSQYENVIYVPIRRFVNLFNQQYAGNESFIIKESRNDVVPENFSLKITMPDSKWICVDTEVIFRENHSKEVLRDPYYPSRGTKREYYIPQCGDRNVIAWSYVRDQSGRGFNLLLVEDKGALYGDWCILRNTNSAFNKEPRVEPFGFTLTELPEEIAHIRSLHIYNSELLVFDEEILLNYLADHA